MNNKEEALMCAMADVAGDALERELSFTNGYHYAVVLWRYHGGDIQVGMRLGGTVQAGWTCAEVVANTKEAFLRAIVDQEQAAASDGTAINQDVGECGPPTRPTLTRVK